MRRLKAALLLLCFTTFVFLLGLSYGFGSPFHYSDDIRFRVIDESTGKPLAGVAILAVWSLEGGIRSPRVPFTLYLGDAGVLHKSEAVSNEQGFVTVPGMPLRLRPPVRYFSYWDPRLFIYKPGYCGATLTNIGLAPGGYRGPFDTTSAKRRSFWQGQTVPLRTADDIGMEADTLAYFRGTAGDVRAFPPDFTRFWTVLAEGYNRLPLDLQRDIPDPQQTIIRRLDGGTL